MVCNGSSSSDLQPHSSNTRGNNTAGGDPNLGHGKGIGINKKTLGWNAAGAVLAGLGRFVPPLAHFIPDSLT